MIATTPAIPLTRESAGTDNPTELSDFAKGDQTS